MDPTRNIQPYMFESKAISKKAGQLGHEDLGSLVKVRTIEGVEFQDVLREIGADYEGVYPVFDHVNIGGRRWVVLDPRSRALIKRPKSQEQIDKEKK